MSGHRTAVCTVATGPHEQLYEISRPSFERFAGHHSYDLIVARHGLSGDRPPAWGKLALLRELLDGYDRVVWVDADAVIVDPSGDIFEGAGRMRPCRLVVHHYDGLEIPNMGVIALISTGWTKRFIERLWASERYVDHKWWENAAALELLGYDVEAPRRDSRRRTAASYRVGELDLSWNSISLDASPRPRIAHFPGMSQADRLAEMENAAVVAAVGSGASAAQRRHEIADGDVGRQGLARLSRVAAR